MRKTISYRAIHVSVRLNAVSFNEQVFRRSISNYIKHYIHYNVLIITRQDCINFFQIFSHVFEFQNKNILRIWQGSKVDKFKNIRIKRCASNKKIIMVETVLF